MSVTIHLTLEQLAEAIAQLSPEEFETLEILLDTKLTQELLRLGGERDKNHQALIKSAAFSAIAIVGAFVWPVI